MHRAALVLSLVSSLLIFSIAWGQESSSADTGTPSDDLRQLVTMPEPARQVMRQDMLSHLGTLNLILGYLAEGDLEGAAEAAESQLGKSSMGKHRVSGMGPGRFMPTEMRNIGFGMHAAASDFAQVAGQGDVKAAYAALQPVTAACLACHLSYRTR